MGSTDYYQATMRAQELASVAITAGELEDWGTWSVFERFQRDLDVRRVRREIVPYLARTRDRFFSSLIVLVYEPSLFDFQPVLPWTSGLPGALTSAADSMGFLTIDGGRLVVLDGQHRLVALRDIVGAEGRILGEFVNAIADDELSVLFIQHQGFQTTRRIFNKVNRYAKPTSISDNVITSEDDGLAIVTRWLVEPEPPLNLVGPDPPLNALDSMREPIVEWRANRLEANSTKLTTLNHLYQTVKIILDANGIVGFDEKHMVNRPPDDELKEAYILAATWWSVVIEKTPVLRKAVMSPRRIPDLRMFQSEDSLLLRPIGQIILFRALAGAFELGMSLDEAVSRANQVYWGASEEHWRNIAIYGNGRLRTKDNQIRLAGRYATYLIASYLMSGEQMGKLERDLRTDLDDYSYCLPPAVPSPPS